jgi:phosphoesterase RecJ-like protein
MQSKNLNKVQLINNLIRPARRILLVTHVAPDGDAIGSLLGLGRFLRKLGKEPIMACEDPVPEIYRWLPGSGEVVRHADGPHDLVISLDCSDSRRMGQSYHDPKMPVPLVNIDHHVTNTMFGTVNWVDPASAATAQMILSLADALEWELIEPTAVCLLTGLVTDTRSFRTSNVDSVAMRAALRLMEAGASLSEITRRALEQRPLASIRLWGEAIEQLHLHGDVLWTEVTRTMRDHWGLDENGDSGLTNFLSSVREASVVIVFTERKDGTVDVGMRAVPGCDVAQVALKLGGGGHPQAAGCTMEGDLVEVRQLVLAEVQQGLTAQRKEP